MSRPCSVEDSFEFVDYEANITTENNVVHFGTTTQPIPEGKRVPVVVARPQRGIQEERSTVETQVSLPSPVCKRTDPLTEERFNTFLDEDGRLVDEHALRKAIFLGGADPSIRKTAWQFLFGLYPCSSTKREREELLLDYIVKYHEMKSRWKTILTLSAKPGTTDLEQGLVAKYQLDDSGQALRSPDFDAESPLPKGDSKQLYTYATHVVSGQPDFSMLSKNCRSLDLNTPEMQQKVAFMKIQAQVYVNRQSIEINEMKHYLRLIDKDVPRTDRDIFYFSGSCNPHLTMLREILITFAAFNPKVGYAQGMNDILSRFLVVFDSEVEAFWCFHNYLIKIQNDFTESGMLRKIELVQQLLSEMDPDLLMHLEKNELGDLLFCHRWLLLGFKREFNFDDSLRCFEILSSHHLELTNIEAETAKRREQMKEFENIAGVTRTAPLETQTEYTFELFMCVALLMQCRTQLLRCTDSAMVFSIINELKIHLDSILEKSEELFFRYCKKNIEDSFLMVETPTNTNKASHNDSNPFR